VTPDLDQIVAGDDQIEDGAAEEDPGPRIHEGREGREEENAADDEGKTADLVEKGIEGFPAKLSTEVFPLSDELEESRSVGNEMWHRSRSLAIARGPADHENRIGIRQ